MTPRPTVKDPYKGMNKEEMVKVEIVVSLKGQEVGREERYINPMILDLREGNFQLQHTLGQMATSLADKVIKQK